jgi:hypothetical protein
MEDAVMKHIVGVALMLAAFGAALNAQTLPTLVGEWRGSLSGRNPITGRLFTIDLTFEFRPNGTYRQVARFGNLPILELDGTYALQAGSKPGVPTFTHMLTLLPGKPKVVPGPDELRLLQIAALPNLDRTEHYIFFYNVAPAGGLTLQDRSGDESWGLRRVP